MDAHASSEELSAPPSEHLFAVQRLDQLLAMAISRLQFVRERVSYPLAGCTSGPTDVAKSLNNKFGRRLFTEREGGTGQAATGSARLRSRKSWSETLISPARRMGVEINGLNSKHILTPMHLSDCPSRASSGPPPARQRAISKE